MYGTLRLAVMQLGARAERELVWLSGEPRHPSSRNFSESRLGCSFLYTPMELPRRLSCQAQPCTELRAHFKANSADDEFDLSNLN